MGAWGPAIFSDDLACDVHLRSGWQTVDSETLIRRPVRELSDEEKKLSPFEIWSLPLLAQRIAEGWRPEDWV